jgi:N-acetylglucosamine malate deacetylase 1
MVNPTGKTLIFSPHADDEVLGCFAFLSPACHVLYLGVEDRPYVSRRERLAEVANSAAKSGFTWEALEHPVNDFRASALIPDLEN